MATQTTNLNLTLPDQAEGYDVGVVNANNTAIDTAVGALQAEIGGGTNSISSKVDAVKAETDKIGASTDTGNTTMFGLLNQLKTQLANANANIATLLANNGSVKTIVTGYFRNSSSTVNTHTVTIPSGMNAEKVVIITGGIKPSQNISNANSIFWTRNGRTITFACNQNEEFTYQIVEFY